LKGYPGYTGQKRIPPIYMRGSIKQRKAFLAGMLDTDGDVSPNGQVRFRNTNRAIVIAVTEVARSLGHKPTMSEGRSILYGEDKGPVWTVVFRSKESPFFLTRKTKVFNERNTYNAERNKYHKIINIRNIKPKPARCLMVDSPSRLFLVSNAMIPTHNSVTQRTILLHILQNPDWRAVLLDPKG
jgi:replicative DNA helicase